MEWKKQTTFAGRNEGCDFHKTTKFDATLKITSVKSEIRIFKSGPKTTYVGPHILVISQRSNIPIFFPSVLSPLHWSCTAYVYCYVWQIYMFLDILYTRMLPSRHSVSSVSAQHIYTSMYHTHTLSLTHTHTRTYTHVQTYTHAHTHTHTHTRAPYCAKFPSRPGGPCEEPLPNNRVLPCVCRARTAIAPPTYEIS